MLYLSMNTDLLGQYDDLQDEIIAAAVKTGKGGTSDNPGSRVFQEMMDRLATAAVHAGASLVSDDY